MTIYGIHAYIISKNQSQCRIAQGYNCLMMNIIQQVTDPMPTNLSYIVSAKLLLLSSLLHFLQKYCYAPRQQRLKKVLITHKYRGSQQFSRVEYSTQIYRFDTRGAKEYLKVLAAELSIQPHLEINYLQQSDQQQSSLVV